jgi:hypothetical protein
MFKQITIVYSENYLSLILNELETMWKEAIVI